MASDSKTTSSLMPVVYIPHGGGPLPLLGDVGHKDLTEFLVNLPSQMPTPKAILMISAHWESDIVSVSSLPNPDMIYDYGGFPEKAYKLQYPAPGNPELATTVVGLLNDHNIECHLDPQRGYDHGTFVPLMLMYPQADIPVVQVSLLRSLDPKSHIKIGQALAPLREQGVLIVGSGMSHHNMRASVESSEVFDQWLTDTLSNELNTKTYEKLELWHLAPFALESHRREEHLLPLHVCFGAAQQGQKPAEKVFSGYLFDKRISAFRWG